MTTILSHNLQNITKCQDKEQYHGKFQDDILDTLLAENTDEHLDEHLQYINV